MISEKVITDSIVGILDSSGEVLGTGFFISKKDGFRPWMIITCAHNLEDYQIDEKVDILINLEDEKITTAARILLKSNIEKEDVAILKLVKEKPSFFVDGLEMTDIQKVEDPAIKTFGYTLDGKYDSKSSFGKIVNPKYVFPSLKSTLHPKVEVEFDYILPGFSGGPVWDLKSGKVIGIVQEDNVIHDDNGVPQKKVYIIPSKTIREVFSNLDNLQLNFDSNTFGSDFAEKEKLYSDFKIRLNKYPSVPKRDDFFIGRTENLNTIIQDILNKDTIAITGVQGMGGVGKTAITVEVCNIFKESWKPKPNYNKFHIDEKLKNRLKENIYFKDGILWVKFEQDIGIDQVLSNIINIQIGLSLTDAKIEEIIRILLTLLYNKDIIIVLDSAEQNPTNFNLLFGIFQKLECPIIVTSRINIVGIKKKVDIKEMQDDEGVALFIKHYSLGDQNISKNAYSKYKEIEKICSNVGGLPLAIKILAMRGAEFTVDIDDILEEITNAVNKFEVLKINNPIDSNERNKNAYKSFSLSYDDPRLSELERDLFAYASTYRYAFKKEDVFDIVPPAKKNNINQNSLNRIVSLGLIEKNIGDDGFTSYFFHPLMREFALLKLRENKEEINVFERKKENFLNSVNYLSARNDNVSEIISTAFECLTYESYDDFYSFVDILDDYLFYTGLWEDKISLLKAAIPTAENLHNERRLLKYRVSLADVLRRQNKKEEANELFKEALELATELGSWKTYFFIQYKFFDLKKDKQISYINLNQRIRETSIKNESYHSGYFYGNLEDLYSKFNLLKYKELSVAHSRKDWNRPSFNLVVGLLGLIKILYENDQFEECIFYYKQLADLSKTIRGYKILELEKSINKNLFSCYLKTGKISEAEKYLDKFRMGSEKLGVVNLMEEYSLLKGQFLLTQKDFAQAIEYFEALKEEEDRFYWLGMLYFEYGKEDCLKFKESRSYFNKAIDFYREEKNGFYFAKVLTKIIELNKLEKVNVEESICILKQALYLNNNPLFAKKDKCNLTLLEGQIKLELGNSVYKNIFDECKENIKALTPDFINQKIPQKIIGKDKKEMVLIDEGLCFVGYGETRYDNPTSILKEMKAFFEEPKFKHTEIVYLYPYYIDKYPVTNFEYDRFCKQTGRPKPAHWNDDTLATFPDYPVTNISSQDARFYAIWARKEIPTEEEWEKACRGPERNTYPWGMDWDDTIVFDNHLNSLINQTFKDFSEVKRIFDFVLEVEVFQMVYQNLMFDLDWYNNPSNISQLLDFCKVKLPAQEEGIKQLKNSETVEVFIRATAVLPIIRLIAVLPMAGQNKLKLLEKLKSGNLDEYWKIYSVLLKLLLKDIVRVLAEDDLFVFEIEIKKRRNNWIRLLRNYFNLPVGYPVGGLEKNKSHYGVFDMIGNVKEIVDKNVEKNGKEAVLVKGAIIGEQKKSCSNELFIENEEKESFINVGFRCVKPVFSIADLEYFKSI